MPRKRRTRPDTTTQPLVTASEIGSYAFCPMAWYLQRQGQPRDGGAERRLELGRARHRAIGRRADRLRLARLARQALLIIGLFLATAALLPRLGVPL